MTFKDDTPRSAREDYPTLSRWARVTIVKEYAAALDEIDALRAELADPRLRAAPAVVAAVQSMLAKPLMPRSAREARNGYQDGWFDALNAIADAGNAAVARVAGQGAPK